MVETADLFRVGSNVAFADTRIADRQNVETQILDRNCRLCCLLMLCNLGTRVARFFLGQQTKTWKNIPNNHKIDQMAMKYTKWP
jgi:predicted small integral membrane protein